MRAVGRPHLRTQVSLDSARIPTRLSDGRRGTGLSHRRRRRRVAGEAQPARGGTRAHQPGSVRMKALLMPVLLLGFAGSLAAQDPPKQAPPAAPPPAAAAAPASNITVDAVLARNVADRAPQDTGSAFPDSVGTVVLWMRVTGANGQTLHHVWFHGGDQVGDVPLTIGGAPRRRWSRETNPAHAEGAGHVEIRDEGGKSLERKRLHVWEI